uniref:UBN2_3 domain-containing protein n=1 Tax=Lactuca sativa TaxID=4236 RepID=A0A9R1USU5_LACSA|nr:hypothetical protein LSAT_V11C800422040 [Lactuca sativa]
MKGNESSIAYLTRAQEYATALANTHWRTGPHHVYFWATVQLTMDTGAWISLLNESTSLVMYGSVKIPPTSPNAPCDPTPPPSPPPPPPRSQPPNLRPNPKPNQRYTSAALNTVSSSTPILEPTSFTAANQTLEWRLAMAEEFNALVKNGTRSLSQVPSAASNPKLATSSPPSQFLFQSKHGCYRCLHCCRENRPQYPQICIHSFSYQLWFLEGNARTIPNHYHLIGYVDGTIKCPEQKITTADAITNNPSYPRWVSNDAHVRMIILSTISEASFQHVQGTTSRDLWLSLERAYAPNFASHEYTLKTQLLRIKMKSDETPLTYLSRAMEYASALANIGEPMKDKDLVMLTISGLRDEYNGLKSNLLARHPPITFSDLHGILSDHDYMINKSATVPITASPQVFVAATGGTPSNSLPDITTIQSQLNSLSLLASQLGYQLNPIGSNNTQTQANYASRPPSNRNNRRGNFRGNSRGQYSTYGRDNNPPNQQFQWASTQNTVYGHCNRCACSDVGSTSATTWFPDTGANSHVTPDLSNQRIP